jgi:hypothetical protein
MEKNIYQKFIAAKRNFKSIVKDAKAHTYKYAKLEQVIDAISEPLWDQGLDFIQIITETNITTKLIDVDKEKDIDLGVVPIYDVAMSRNNKMQEWGAGVTYAKRYALLTAFGLATEDDDAESLNNVQIKKSQPNQNKSIIQPAQINLDELVTNEELDALQELYIMKLDIIQEKNILSEETQKKLRLCFADKEMKRITYNQVRSKIVAL